MGRQAALSLGLRVQMGQGRGGAQYRLRAIAVGVPLACDRRRSRRKPAGAVFLTKRGAWFAAAARQIARKRNSCKFYFSDCYPATTLVSRSGLPRTGASPAT